MARSIRDADRQAQALSDIAVVLAQAGQSEHRASRGPLYPGR